MYNKFHLLIFVVVTILSACEQQKSAKTKIVQIDRIESFLQNTQVNKSAILKLESEMAFWKERLSHQPKGYIYHQKLSSLHVQFYKKPGDVGSLQAADSLLLLAGQHAPSFAKTSIYHALASLSIMQHKFIASKNYALKAYETNTLPFTSGLLLFDASMEIGYFQLAKGLLKKIEPNNTFGYLIRVSKFQDHLGNLDSAIYYMEKAGERIGPKQLILYPWVHSNLGDMHGHAGRIDDAYSEYLLTLSMDSSNFHALKGIARIAYAHDDNPALALRILEFIKTNKQRSPDIDWLKSEIFTYQGNRKSSQALLKEFQKEVTMQSYGDMYNKYLVQMLVETESEKYKALEIAKIEIGKRPTPQTYDLLAWSHFKNGNTRQALRLASEYVDKQTYEPKALYHMGIIYAAAGKRKIAKYYLEDALKSSFELGPLTCRAIEEELMNLSL